jgi:hypothetical protein
MIANTAAEERSQDPALMKNGIRDTTAAIEIAIVTQGNEKEDKAIIIKYILKNLMNRLSKNCESRLEIIKFILTPNSYKFLEICLSISKNNLNIKQTQLRKFMNAY